MAKQHKATLSDIPPVDSYDIADRIYQYRIRLDELIIYRNQQGDQELISKLNLVITNLQNRLKDYILTVKC